MARWQYAVRVLRQRWRGAADSTCPYCGQPSLRRGGKWLLLSLRECAGCGLRFRVPKDREPDARRYYESTYREPTATDVPADHEWRVEPPARFRRFLKDRVEFLEEVVAATRPRKALDFGCSWGYTTEWLARRGVARVIGFEISESRAALGRRRLGLHVYTGMERLLQEHAATFDLVYTAHVLEHLPHLQEVFGWFRRLLVPTGALAIAVPNASDGAAGNVGRVPWRRHVGEAHTMALTYSFLERALGDHGFAVTQRGDPRAAELRVIARLL